jgi:hypothetical protein
VLFDQILHTVSILILFVDVFSTRAPIIIDCIKTGKPKPLVILHKTSSVLLVDLNIFYANDVFVKLYYYTELDVCKEENNNFWIKNIYHCKSFFISF